MSVILCVLKTGKNGVLEEIVSDEFSGLSFSPCTINVIKVQGMRPHK
jgi:hypothetical protein